MYILKAIKKKREFHVDMAVLPRLIRKNAVTCGLSSQFELFIFVKMIILFLCWFTELLKKLAWFNWILLSSSLTKILIRVRLWHLNFSSQVIRPGWVSQLWSSGCMCLIWFTRQWRGQDNKNRTITNWVFNVIKVFLAHTYLIDPSWREFIF